ncbi:MAG: hypothetical protein MUC36_02200 [Planctomycetes bacterium]|jgi:hypothetical protein|nr:hypothetical protein [Planctomycetota bacterium]
MSSSLSSDRPAPGGRPAARIGRLVPVTGITPRPHPDRGQLMQFLDELRLPLAAVQTMLEVAEMPDLPESVQLALCAAASHNDSLLELVADYAELGRLEADLVTPVAQRVALPAWLEGQLQAQQPTATWLGLELRLQHRSFLPSQVEFDAPLLARALDAVLHVAMHRALPGPLDVRVSYLHGRGLPGPSRLRIDIGTRGGGYTEVEQGYACAPFAVRDGACRPLLGLTIAQRLCTLLQGELRVESPGLSACNYRLEVAALPTIDARWVDPLAPHRRSLGPVSPGRVLFVGRSQDTRILCSPPLQRAGYAIAAVDSEDQIAEVILDEVRRWSAIVVDPSCSVEVIGGLVERLRGYGFVGKVVAVQGADATTLQPVAVDAVLHTPVRGAELLDLLTADENEPDRYPAPNA